MHGKAIQRYGSAGSKTHVKSSTKTPFIFIRMLPFIGTMSLGLYYVIDHHVDEVRNISCGPYPEDERFACYRKNDNWSLILNGSCKLESLVYQFIYPYFPHACLLMTEEGGGGVAWSPKLVNLYDRQGFIYASNSVIWGVPSHHYSSPWVALKGQCQGHLHFDLYEVGSEVKLALKTNCI